MKLYHGSNVAVRKPRILKPNRALDFGTGFYCTSDEAQARRWALRQQKRIRRYFLDAEALVSIYEFDLERSSALTVLTFPKPNTEWLDFVSTHRSTLDDEADCDLIIGPVANDNTYQVIQDYMHAPNKDLYLPVALDRIKADKLKDQYVFKTEAALKTLTFTEVQRVG